MADEQEQQAEQQETYAQRLFRQGFRLFDGVSKVVDLTEDRQEKYVTLGFKNLVGDSVASFYVLPREEAILMAEAILKKYGGKR